MKINALIPFIFCLSIVFAQNEIESVLDQHFQVIRIEGFDEKLWKHRIYDLELIETFRDPLLIEINNREIKIYNKMYKFVINYTIIHRRSLNFNLNGEKFELPPLGNSKSIPAKQFPIRVPNELEAFEIFFTDLLMRMERIEITEETIILSNSSDEKVVIKR
jgi:hypothetical protein